MPGNKSHVGTQFWNNYRSSPPDSYNRRFGDPTAAELVRDHVLRLTYTAHDMEPFARDLGYGGLALHLGRGRTPPPPRPPRRALLPPLRPRPRRRRLHPQHFPHRPPPRRGPIRRPLPHQRAYPCLYERPRRGRHRRPNGAVDAHGVLCVAPPIEIGEQVLFPLP